MVAARRMGIDDLEINEVYYWDGDENLETSEEDVDTPMSEDEVPEPPERVTKIYQEATPSVRELGRDPSSKAASERLKSLNKEIMAANKDEGLPLIQWQILVSFF